MSPLVNRDVKMSPENLLSSLMKFYVRLKLVYQEFLTLLAAILKFKNAGLAGICANVNYDFQILHALSFLKIYSFLIPIKFEQNYIVNLTKWRNQCRLFMYRGISAYCKF